MKKYLFFLFFISLFLFPFVNGFSENFDEELFFYNSQNVFQIKNNLELNSREINLVNDNCDFYNENQGFIIEYFQEPIIKQNLNYVVENKKENLFFEKIPFFNFFNINTLNFFNKFKNDYNDISFLENSNNLLKKEIYEKIEKENIFLAEFNYVFNGVLLDISYEDAMKIKEIEGVKNVWPNEKVSISLYHSVPSIQNWILAGRLDEDGNDCFLTGKKCLTGEGIKIAILDTGVDYTHPSLGGCFGNDCKVVGGYDFINDNFDPMDDHGHGTHVAGIAAGKGVLNGVAPDANILAYKVLDKNGAGFFSDVILGIEKSILDGADIISLSLGGNGNPEDPLSKAVDNAVLAGKVVVVSAGNKGPSEETITSPATSRKAISVGATEFSSNVASFSSRGPVFWISEDGKEKSIIKPDLVSPGVDICAPQFDDFFDENHCYHDKHITLSGTSMSAPHVSGGVALLKQKHPDWTPQEIKSSLKGTSEDIFAKLFEQGSGKTNFKNLVSLEKPFPISEILTGGKFIGENISIFGNAFGQNFKNYTLYYSKNLGRDYIEICSSDKQKNNAVLCFFDTTFFSEGKYFLKLNVFQDDFLSTSYSIIEIRNTEISEPFNLRGGLITRNLIDEEIKVIWRTDEPIKFYGSVWGTKEFGNYELKWRELKSSSFFSDEGIGNLSNSRVRNNLLGVWNIPGNLKSGFYEIMLVNNFVHQNNEIKKIVIYLEDSLLEGWPRKSDFSGSSSFALSFKDQPTISDINGDGKNNLIITYDRRVDVLDGFGNSLPGWPIEINTLDKKGRRSVIQFASAVGDINLDGNLEIVFGDNSGYIHVLKNNGEYLYEPKNFGFDVVGSLTLSDINNNGFLEIIWGGWDNKLYVLDNKLNLLDGFPKILKKPSDFGHSYFSFGSVSVGDINNNGFSELIVESSSFLGGSILDAKSRIWIFDKDGFILDNWPKDFDYMVGKEIVLADVNNDGKKEIIFGTFKGNLYILDYLGKNIDSNWPISINNVPKGAENEWMQTQIYVDGVSVGDINLDGNLEIVFTGKNIINSSSGNPMPSECLFVYDIFGKIFQEFPICRDNIDYYFGFSGIPVLIDLDSDDELEIITSISSGTLFSWGMAPTLSPLYAIKNNGSLVKGFPKYLDKSPFGNVIPAGDFNNNGRNEFFVKTWGGQIYLYSSEGNSNFSEWPQFQKNQKNTGCYDCFYNQEKKSFSKIINFMDSDFDINLVFLIEKFSEELNSWFEIKRFSEGPYLLLAKQGNEIDLAQIFNNKEIIMDSPGNYSLEIFVVEKNTGKIMSKTKEFFYVNPLKIVAELLQ